VNKDTVADDKVLKVIRYEADAKQKQPVTFSVTEDEELEIKDFQVICTVEISKETSTKLTLAKKASIECNKLMENIYDSVKEKLNDESD
jgi:hypothetical protein